MNMLEADLDMQNVRTNIATIIYLDKPEDDQLLSQSLAELSGGTQYGHSRSELQEQQQKQKQMKSLKTSFFSQQGLICIGKVVPNKMRDHDTLVFEVMLPADLHEEENMARACEIVAPLLILSQQVVIDL